MKFWPEYPWEAMLPNHGKVCYQANKGDFSDGKIRLLISDKDEFKFFKWTEVKDDLLSIPSDYETLIADFSPVRESGCRMCKSKLDSSKKFKMCEKCIGIICKNCGFCPCHDPYWTPPFDIL